MCAKWIAADLESIFVGPCFRLQKLHHAASFRKHMIYEPHVKNAKVYNLESSYLGWTFTHNDKIVRKMNCSWFGVYLCWTLLSITKTASRSVVSKAYGLWTAREKCKSRRVSIRVWCFVGLKTNFQNKKYKIKNKCCWTFFFNPVLQLLDLVDKNTEP